VVRTSLLPLCFRPWLQLWYSLFKSGTHDPDLYRKLKMIRINMSVVVLTQGSSFFLRFGTDLQKQRKHNSKGSKVNNKSKGSKVNNKSKVGKAANVFE